MGPVVVGVVDEGAPRPGVRVLDQCERDEVVPRRQQVLDPARHACEDVGQERETVL
jgi:hypothetical protein